MDLWLFSSGDSESNAATDELLMKQVRSKHSDFTFIATNVDEADEYYDEFIDRFSSYGYTRFHMIIPGKEITKKQLKALLSSDVVYLSGGNTFDLLGNLRQSAMMTALRGYAKVGILAGHSAGAIIMSPNIKTASYPDFDCDMNRKGYQDWRALQLVQFEFFPHYSVRSGYDNDLILASSEVSHPIYGVEDGGAIRVTDLQTTFFGRVWGYVNGRRVKVR